MEDIVITKLEEKDIEQAANILSDVQQMHIIQRTDIFIPKQEDWIKNLKESMLNEDCILLVARKGCEVVGACQTVIKRCGDDVETKKRTIWFIDYIAVKEEYRRCKIGTKLLDRVKALAKENKADTLELNVWGFNKDAIDFYEQNDMKQKRIVYEYFIK